MSTGSQEIRSPPGALLAAVASRAIQHLVDGVARRGTVLGASTHVAWLGFGGHVLVVGSPDAIRFPNGILLARREPLIGFRAGDECRIGDGRVEIGETGAAVVRWWDPRPELPDVTRSDLGSRSEAARRLFLDIDDGGLTAATQEWDPSAVRHAAYALLGRGEGLTPEGDDLLVGFLAALRLLGPAVGDAGARDMLGSIAPIIATEARGRTTALSAALLNHAVAGEVALPVADFLRAIAGSGDLQEVCRGMRAMGNTTGHAVANGVMIVADLLARGSRR